MRKIGTVKWFDKLNGIGSIQPDGEEEADFIHLSEVIKAGMFELEKGQRVSYLLNHNTVSAGELQVVKEVSYQNVAA